MAETKREREQAKNEGPKWCSCGKQAVNFNDGDGLKCPQHFTKGEDLYDSDPFGDNEFKEADEGTNKGATELAVQEAPMSDAGKEQAKEPTQDATVLEDTEEVAVGNSAEATALADARGGKVSKTVGGEKLEKSEPRIGTKNDDARAGISEEARTEADALDAASGDSSVDTQKKANAEKGATRASAANRVSTDGAAGARKGR